MLLIPDPNEDGQFRNSVVNSIYEDVPYSSMASMASFVSFCTNQREERLKLQKKYGGLMKLGELLRCSQDRRWSNVRKFREIETIDRKLYQSSNETMTFLCGHVRKIDEALIKQHHTNTINFLQGMEVTIRGQKVEIGVRTQPCTKMGGPVGVYVCTEGDIKPQKRELMTKLKQ